jgi:lipid II:glycine glycyltransferase (peptidoglycan interpeptide bridge formation enzyme)
MMTYRVNPLQDARWQRFSLEHPSASIFHTPAWLEALRRTYGYEPVVATTCAPGRELTNGIVYCRIKSRLTGRRLVSLPFSDHCEPLTNEADGREHLLSSLQRDVEKENLLYVEIRPLASDLECQPGFGEGKKYWFNQIDLGPSLDELFRRFHKDSVQRKIRRAEREALSCEEGRSESLLRKFYHLLLLTRRRHQLPPHPYNWFRNLIDCLGDRIKIWLASKDNQPIASILTLHHKDTLVYKYGCSDASFNQLGGTQLLFWRTIQQAKHQGVREFDLGRSDYDNPGLVTFKDRWGSTRSQLTYWRYPAPPVENHRPHWSMRLGKQVLAHMPDSLLIAAGNLFYKHVG